MTKRRIAKTLFPFLIYLLLAKASPALADDAAAAPAIDPANDPATGINIMWMLISGFLVFFMQAGFALVETGFTRAKNVAHTMMMNVMVFCIGALGYWLTGFAFQFGAVNNTLPAVGEIAAWAHSPTSLGDWTGVLSTPLLQFGEQNTIIGGSGFLLAGLGMNVGVLAFFLFQMVFMDTAATIPTGSMAERLKFSGFILMSLWVSMVIYPIVGGWIWGGGWIQNLGRSAGIGNGAVDFAGSGVVHMIGGAIALAGAIVIGPRIGRFNRDGSPNALPGHNIPMGVLGTIILFFGWFGFNPGSSLAFMGAGRSLAVIAAINTLLAGAMGGVASMYYMWLVHAAKKPDPAMSVNGVLAGLVAITAPCAFVDTWAAVVIGLVAGILVALATQLLEKLRIDDPVGACPVHLVNGAWGVISVGIFANGNSLTAGWNGVSTPVTGLLYGGTSQILAQLIEAGSIFVVVTGLSYLFFKAVSGLGLLRVAPVDEMRGLDLPEMGMLGYDNDDMIYHGHRIKQPLAAVTPTKQPPIALVK